MDTEKTMPSRAEVVQLAGARTGNLFEAGGYCCSESILLLLNEGFGAGLTPEMALNLGSGFCEGMGGAGCTCGGLGGGVIGLGLFVGPHGKDGLRKKRFRELSKLLHDRFRERFSATCCRVLRKKAEKEGKGGRGNCKMLTMGGAELVVELLLDCRPELMERVDLDYLRKKESKIEGRVKKIFGKI